MADTLEAIPDVWRNGDERVVALADEELLELAFGRGAVAIVEEDELDGAVRDGVVDGHSVMQVPAFDDTGVHGREIDLPEPFEMRVVRAEHVHDLPALVGDLPERDNTDAFDHGIPPRYERYHSIVDRRPSSSDTRAFHPRTRFALSVERRCSLISFFAMFSTRGSGSWPPMSFAMALTIARTLTCAPEAKLKASPVTSGRSKASAMARYASTTSEM